MARSLGSLLILLREGKGLSQKEAAEKLCELAGVATVTRHEVSRWERGDRLPSDVWLEWLSKVYQTPLVELVAARGRSKRVEPGAASGGRKKPGKPAEAVPGTAGRKRAGAAPEEALTLVSLRFERRATSVQLSGTYEEPEHATDAIGVFRRLVRPRTVRGSDSGAGLRQPEVQAPPNPGKRVPAPAGAALTASRTTGVPMGIRYTSGSGDGRYGLRQRHNGQQHGQQPGS